MTDDALLWDLDDRAGILESRDLGIAEFHAMQLPLAYLLRRARALLAAQAEPQAAPTAAPTDEVRLLREVLRWALPAACRIGSPPPRRSRQNASARAAASDTEGAMSKTPTSNAAQDGRDLDALNDDLACAAIAALRAELDDAVSALRTINEETVLAGLPGGDRAVTLANVRALRARAERAEADAERYRWLREATADEEDELRDPASGYLLYRDLLDAAIDRARTQETKK